MYESRHGCSGKPECRYKCLKSRSAPYSKDSYSEKTGSILFAYIYLKIHYGLNKNFYALVEDELTEFFLGHVVDGNQCKVIRVNGTKDDTPMISDTISENNEPVISGCKDMVRFLLCKYNSFFSQPCLKKKEFIELRTESRIVGIVDRDFETDDEKNQVQYDEKQFSAVFRTETNDIESFISKYGGLKKFIENINAKSAKKIQDEIVSQSSMIGLARHISINRIPETERINFDHIKNFNPFCDYISKSCSMTEEQAISLIQKSSTYGRSDIFPAMYKSQLPKREKNFQDLWEICHGKDTIKILLCYINYCSKSKSNFRVDEVKAVSSKISRFALDDKSFIRSRFMKELLQWEMRVRPLHPATGKLFKEFIYS
jgi:hypothetical protein